MRLLERAAEGGELSGHHVEAAIASVHATARAAEDTNWIRIVGLYDLLMKIGPSPVVALNRAIAVAQVEGPERGLAEMERIAGKERLAEYPFYPAAMGEMELRRGNREAAREHFNAALRLARNPMEARFLAQKLESQA
jgi:RNA polymerase sigma-70 factor (ECF subfamily)